MKRGRGLLEMAIVEFKFDKEKDLQNIWETANSKITYGKDFKKNLTPNILDICENKKYDLSKKQLNRTMNYLHKNKLISVMIGSFNEAWEKIEKEYFNRLEKITKCKFPFTKVYAYLTSAGRCSYDPRPKHISFYFNFFGSVFSGVETAGHELMHIHLHNIGWWKKVEKEIGDTKTHDLKEALTELLNLEFRDLWVVEDKGYPNHKKLREYISLQWKKKKTFNKLTISCIKWIKKNGIK